MDLKVYLKNNRRRQILLNLDFVLLIAVLFFLSGCVSTGIKTETGKDELPEPEIVKQEERNRLVSASRPNASHSLTQEGYELLCKKDYDGAIRLLERAVGINPSDGTGYYYLAEAWIGKKNYQLATQFNRLASIYLRKSDKWIELARIQKKRLKELK